jgi:2'-5' RNA ligase
MRYFIGYILRGEVAEFCKATCTELAEKFSVDDVSKIVPPHLKIKSPFEFRNIEMIEKIVASCAEAPALPLTLEGWDHFESRTVFIDAKGDTAVMNYLSTVLDKFRAARIMVTPLEAKLKLHLSVARFLKPDTYQKVWDYLSSVPAPRFDVMLDNLTIFAQEKDAKNWTVYKTFPLVGKR